MSLDRQLRAGILNQADQAKAIELANFLTNHANDHINASDVSAATSLLARAFAARSILAVASEWAADMTGAPLPEAAKALRSLVDDLPLCVEEQIWIDPEIAAENKRRFG